MFFRSDHGYFRASSPRRGDSITIVFDDDDVTLNRLKVDTGLPRQGGELSDEYSLPGGVVEASPRLLRFDAVQNTVLCADFVKIGELKRGVAELDDLRKALWGRTTKCLRVTVKETDGAGSDVIFAQISVYT